jgi:hypothetical protein
MGDAGTSRRARPCIHNDLAIAGFLVAILGCIVAMVAAAGTLASSRVSARDLRRSNGIRRYATRERQFYYGFDSLDELLETHEDVSETRIRGFRDNDSATVASAERTRGLTKPMVDNMLKFVSYEQLRRRFILSVTGVVVGVATTAVGALMFAAGVPEGESPSALEKAPVYAELSVNSDAQDRYADALGPECDIKNLLVVVLSSDSDSYEILASSPDDNCPLAFMNVGRDDATIHPCPGGTIDGQNALAPASAPSTSATPQPRGGDEQAACPLIDGSDLDIQIIRYRPSVSASTAPRADVGPAERP